jgi:hypothetical protein
MRSRIIEGGSSCPNVLWSCSSDRSSRLAASRYRIDIPGVLSGRRISSDAAADSVRRNNGAATASERRGLRQPAVIAHHWGNKYKKSGEKSPGEARPHKPGEARESPGKPGKARGGRFPGLGPGARAREPGKKDREPGKKDRQQKKMRRLNKKEVRMGWRLYQ